jgi:uncharacterized protein YodC (DUF2158 family)
MSFNIGDTVQLRSGGPNMTITRIGMAGGEPMLWCAWFEGTKDTYALFPPDALRAPSEPPKVPATASEAFEAAPEPLAAPPETQSTRVDSIPVTPEAGEASQEPHPKPDSAPLAGGHGKSDQDQLASIQSLIASLLKRS